MRFQTPLSKARGLGTARLGTAAWWAQRVTAVALLPLSLWLVWFVDRLLAFSHAEMATWLSRPHNAVLLLAYVGAAGYHAMLGLKVIVEDYVHAVWLKTLSLVAIQLVWILLVLTAAIAMIRTLVAG